MAASIRSLIRAARGEIEGLRRPLADTRDGSGIDIHMGTAAVLFARGSAVADEMFEDISFDTAKERFRLIAEQRFNETPRADQRGRGMALLERTGSTAGTLYDGTAFQVLSGGQRRVLLIDGDHEAGSETELSVSVRAADVAPQIDGLHSGSFIDEVWDSTWRVKYLRVSAGFPGETPEDFRTRKKRERHDGRVGYAEAIRLACRRAGAAHVALFEDTFASDTFGLSHCYVSDGAFEASPALVNRCRLAVDRAAVGGCDLWVGAMTRQYLRLSVAIHTWQATNAIPVPFYRRLAEQAIRSHFEGRENAFVFDATGIAAAVQAAVPVTQKAIITADPTPPDVTTMFAAEPLPRYDLGALHVGIQKADGN